MGRKKGRTLSANNFEFMFLTVSCVCDQFSTACFTHNGDSD